MASLGDLDGDGVTDLAVGANGDDTGTGPSSDRGAVHVLLLNAERHGEEQREDCQRHQRRPHAREP